MKLAGIEWDDSNSAKCQKHGVSIEEIDALLFGEDLGILPDTKHSQTEDRFLGIGKTGAGRWVFLVFTLRNVCGEAHARPVSARYMHNKEVQRYEKDTHS